MPTNLRFDRYYPYAELTDILHGLAEAHPELIKLHSIGKSYEGRDLWLVTAAMHFATGPADEKPAVWVDARAGVVRVEVELA